MKAHRKILQQKRRLLLPCTKWLTGFGLLRKPGFPQWYCFHLKKKKQTANSADYICHNRGYWSRKRRRLQLSLGSGTSRKVSHLKKQKTIENWIAHHKKVHRGGHVLKAAATQSVLKDRTEDQCLVPIKKEGYSAFQGVDETFLCTLTNPDAQSVSSPPDDSSPCFTDLPIKKSSNSLYWEQRARRLPVVLNGNETSPETIRACVLDPPICKTKSNIFHCLKKRSSLFMMHKKPSLFKFRCRIKSQFRARNKTIKLRELNQNCFHKVARGLGADLRASCERDVCNLFSSLTVKSSPVVQRLHRSPDMNSNISGLLNETKECIPEGYPGTDPVKLKCNERQFEKTVPKRQEAQNTTSEWACTESLATEEVDVTPVVNNCLPDIFVLVTDKEDPDQVVCSNAEFNVVSDVDGQTESNKEDSSTHVPVSSEEPVLQEHVGPVDSSCQMEVDQCTDPDVFSMKLPFKDHLYCKRPHEDPSSEDASIALEKQEGEIQSGKQDGVKNGPKISSLVTDQQLTAHICGFLNETMKKYGSLIPLSEKDVLARLKEIFNEDFSSRKAFITKEIMKYRAKHSKVSTCTFRVYYNKHMLDMDDLVTLDGQNWLNDQVINMYGELIMDAVPDKVHFFNSFFHRQLVTKGYNGVKRWTKKVDLFKKTLLLIPIHLEVHWSLITVNLPDRIISFYDSQGIHFKFCVENIRKYLSTEARENNNPDFLQGWQTAVNQCIPQQKNDSDCGVFVLQYCKCLALGQPFQFSQDDMPRVRKRIYKELCERRLMD